MKVRQVMNRNVIFALLLLVVGIFILGYSVATGEGTASVFLFIPVFYGSGLFAFLGVLCLMGAMILGFLGMGEMVERKSNGEDHPRSTSKPASTKEKSGVKGGGVVLIGPIPIIFGSDPKTAFALTIVALAIIVAAIILIVLSFAL